MTNFKVIAFLVLFCSVFSHSSNAQIYQGKAKDINQILSNIKDFSQAYMDGDIEKIVASYTTDGKIFPNNKAILEGQKDLFSYWQIPEGVKIAYHKISPSEITIVKKTAYDYGYYEGKTLLADGKEVAWKGKYVIIWKKIGKEWKMYLDIWNRVEE